MQEPDDITTTEITDLNGENLTHFSIAEVNCAKTISDTFVYHSDMPIDLSIQVEGKMNESNDDPLDLSNNNVVNMDSNEANLDTNEEEPLDLSIKKHKNSANASNNEKNCNKIRFNIVLPEDLTLSWARNKQIEENSFKADQKIYQDLCAAKIINWWTTDTKLFPTQTTSDGNCLCHAIMQSVAFTEDTELRLRDELNNTFTSGSLTDQLRELWETNSNMVQNQLGFQLISCVYASTN